ncbi:MAG: hypothetical protein QOI80_394 [Solirubrobacteraceae bacterium]|nr:hypothetical protein [Solirubrobacteraceae bacterium]
MTTADTVSFTPASFTWESGVFVLTGDWAAEADGLGRVRLLVDVDGRQRNIGAQGGKTAGGEGWRATFVCNHEPDTDARAALKVADTTIALPPPDLAAPPEEQEATSLIEELRSERAALDRARHALARERKAAEEVEARLSAVRRRVGAAPEPEAPQYAALGYAVGAAIAFLFLLVLIWVL